MLVKNSTQNIDTIDFREGATLLIDKPTTWTSFDVVAKVRSLLSKKLKTKKLKVGHGGTLDPLASGLMVLGIGKHTKKLQSFQDEGKEYIAELKFGATTASYDAETDEENTFPIEQITEEALKQKLVEEFTGEIEQIPPIYSAKSINGKRAYDLARKGEAVELKPIQVTISEIELISFEAPYATIRVACSKGTYIRSLANDIGKSLESGAYLTKLKRTRSGSFLLSDAFELETFQDALKSGVASEN